MNTLPESMRLTVLKLLVEGNSISSVSRITNVHRDTVCKHMVGFGKQCQVFLDREMRDLSPQHLEVDEIHTFVRKKDRVISGAEPDLGRIGSIFIHIAFDQHTRLIPAYRVGRRDGENTEMFIADLASRIRTPNPHASDGHAYREERVRAVVQVSSDGWKAYPNAVDAHFGGYADYAQIVKKKVRMTVEEKALLPKGKRKTKLSVEKRLVFGSADPDVISTSLVERNNLTIRTFMRRLMRKTLGFSKKFENLEAATAVHIAHYNYCWKHKTLGTSPAHAAGIAPRAFNLRELYEEVRKVEA